MLLEVRPLNKGLCSEFIEFDPQDTNHQYCHFHNIQRHKNNKPSNLHTIPSTRISWLATTNVHRHHSPPLDFLLFCDRNHLNDRRPIMWQWLTKPLLLSIEWTCQQQESASIPMAPDEMTSRHLLSDKANSLMHHGGSRPSSNSNRLVVSFADLIA